MGNGGKQTWKRVRGRRVEGSFALSSKPRPVTIFSSSLFFVLHFQLFMVYVQLEQRALLALCYWSAGTDLVVLTFQLLLDCETVIFFFFLVFFLLFFSLSVSIVFFDVFFASLPSLTQSFPLPHPFPPPSAPDKGERPFAPDPSFDYSAFLAYAKSTGCFVVRKTLHWLTF